MAIKERLLKQLNTVWDGLRAMPPFHSRDLQAMRNALLQARELCFQGLAENRFAEYKDTFDGLLLVAEQLAADAPDKEEIISLCSELLQYMIAQTQKETAFKKEIFFLPYKASMWDSLESVWKAADKDKEHCIAYVMPIPYADLTPEHTVAEWHCERGLFPKYVPTVNWEEFDLQEIHPDVIFIHNPYDAYNRVTSVESRFYSSKLKKQTDKLVYIPYFVLPKLEFDDKSEKEIQQIEERIEHFVTTPAVLNADLVIVQSEVMRRVYIDVLTRRTDRTDRKFWEKRILGTGSPKFDKVADTRKEEFDLPKKWQKLISGRKAILYNTGLSAMLDYTDRFIEKIKSVLAIFKTHDDVMLWWRPHPLLKSTFQSMHPELLEAYEEIVNAYRQEGWGIFDDTAELERAVAWTDEYYGDPSSVAQLYHLAGKPVVYQVVPPMDDIVAKFRWKLYAPHGLVIGDEFYFTPMNYNGLFVFHMDEGRLEHLSWLGGNVNRFWCCGGICDLGDKLFIVPANNEEAHIIDFFGFEKEKIPVSREYVDGRIDANGTVQFYGAYLIDGKVWMVPHHGRAMASYDLNVQKVEFYPELSGLLQNVQEDKYPLYGNSVMARGSLWIIAAQSPQILQFDLNTKKAVAHAINEEDGKIGYIDYDGNNFWIYSLKGVLMCWTPEDGIKKRVVNPLGLDKNYGGIKYVHGKIWLIASYQDVFGSFDIKTEEIHIYRDKMNHVDGGILGAAVLKVYDEDVYVLPHYGNMFVRIQTKTRKVNSWKIEFTPEIKDKYQKEYMKMFRSTIWEWDNEAVFYVLKERGTLATECNTKDAGGTIYRSVIA